MSAPSDMPDRPIVRLKPKTRPIARRVRHGFPWVYASDLVTDRRTRALSPGTLAVLQDENRAPLGLVAVTPGSKIICRMIDRDTGANVDTDWFADRIGRAAKMRDRLYEAPFYRLVHAEADGLPGVVIDRFDAICVVQPNAAWADRRLADLTGALLGVPGVTTVLKNAGGRARGLEGLDDVSGILAGQAPKAPVQVPMNGAVYMADLTGGQKTGLFFDQRDNHRFAARLARGARVLDVFSHVGGFALACLAGGAASAVCVDGSTAALALAQEGAGVSGFGSRLSTRAGDGFDVLNDAQTAGEKFDVVICDPPAFAPTRSALEPGLRAYERLARLAAPLVEDGGYLVLCSCSHAAGLDRFLTASARGIGRAGRKAQLIHAGQAGPDHPQLPQLAESGYLKSLFFRL